MRASLQHLGGHGTGSGSWAARRSDTGWVASWVRTMTSRSWKTCLERDRGPAAEDPVSKAEASTATRWSARERSPTCARYGAPMLRRTQTCQRSARAVGSADDSVERLLQRRRRVGPRGSARQGDADHVGRPIDPRARTEPGERAALHRQSRSGQRPAGATRPQPHRPPRQHRSRSSRRRPTEYVPARLEELQADVRGTARSRRPAGTQRFSICNAPDTPTTSSTPDREGCSLRRNRSSDEITANCRICSRWPGRRSVVDVEPRRRRCRRTACPPACRPARRGRRRR